MDLARKRSRDITMLGRQGDYESEGEVASNINPDKFKVYKVDPQLKQQLDALVDPQQSWLALKKKPQGLPVLPAWTHTRFSLVAYGDRSNGQGQVTGVLAGLPAAVREMALLEDLLFVMTGIDGKYIHVTRPHSSHEKLPLFTMDPSIESSCYQIVEQIIPISHHYMNVNKFVASTEQFDLGLVSQALCAAINSILKDYLVLVAQLEKQLRENKLTLQKLLFYVQSEMKKMALLDHITSVATGSGASGGALLNLLYTTSASFASANMATEKLLFLLLQHAAAPYLEMLGLWIFKGKTRDPYGEFMIEEHYDQQKEHLNEDVNDAYWEQKYTLRNNQVPIFLEKTADKILTTGKYLNVMAECGREVKFHDADTILVYTTNQNEYMDKIERAYDMASRKLLDLLCNELDLLNRLRSIKRYFLLDQGDFFTHFMDTAVEELQKPVRDISKSKLKSLLELSLRTSSVADVDLYKDDLGLDFHPYTLLDMLLRIIHVAHGSIFVNPMGLGGGNDEVKGLDVFTFSYTVRWPLSLVVSRKVLIKYQLLFRQLAFCKNVERQLSNEWILSMNTKFAHRGFQPASALRHKMIHFLQNLQYYMMVEVIEPNWHKFEVAFRKVRTVDEVLKIHTDFVDSCLNECMLTDSRLVKIIMKLMAICEAFANVIKRLMDSLSEPPRREQTKKKDSKAKHRQHEEMVRASVPIFDTTLLETIKSADDHFKYHLKLLLDDLKACSTTGESNHYMIHLLTRLDYNGFYTHYFLSHPVLDPRGNK